MSTAAPSLEKRHGSSANLSRFSAILQIMAGVLLGLLISDLDSVRSNFVSYWSGFRSTDPDLYWTAAFATYVLIALVIRNIHGSARWDEWVEERARRPTYEKWQIGRASVFLLSVVALFGPYCTDHMLAKHFQKVQGVSSPALLLCLPLFAYGLWNLLIWVSDEDNDMIQLATRWVKIDACCLVVFLFGEYIIQWRSENAPPETMVAAFVVVGAANIIMDYTWNKNYYFPES